MSTVVRFDGNEWSAGGKFYESSFTILEDGIEVGKASTTTYQDGITVIDRVDIESKLRGRGIGTKALRDLWVKFDKIVIVPDNDDAGRLYARMFDLLEDIEATGNYKYSEYGELDQGCGVYVGK